MIYKSQHTVIIIRHISCHSLFFPIANIQVSISPNVSQPFFGIRWIPFRGWNCFKAFKAVYDHPGADKNSKGLWGVGMDGWMFGTPGKAALNGLNGLDSGFHPVEN